MKTSRTFGTTCYSGPPPKPCISKSVGPPPLWLAFLQTEKLNRCACTAMWVNGWYFAYGCCRWASSRPHHSSSQLCNP